MRKTTLLGILIIILLASLNPALAATGKTTLLTIADNGNETIGGTADLILEVKPGTGRIFIDSFPLTKIDTQISTRFAKEVACSFLEMDCSDKDFFYTIRTKSSLVGGPSAGAGITILTISVLDNIPLDEKTVITGTINSGGIIGPVSGLKEKAEAAKKEGFTKILVPTRSIISVGNRTNETEKNYTLQYADTLEVEGITIVTVSMLEDALHEFTGKKYPDHNYEIKISEDYTEIMGGIANNLCERYSVIYSKIPPKAREKFNVSLNNTKETMEKARNSLESGDYYSAASYCFTSNVAAREAEYSSYTNETLVLFKKELEQELNVQKNTLKNKKLETLSDLEAYIIVSERLLETEKLLSENETNVLDGLPYITERLESAKAWSGFFNYKGKPINLNEQHLAEACLSKINEADERINYLDVTIGETTTGKDELKEARELHAQKEYAFCLFKASKVKADANAILSTIFITDEKLPELIADQLKLARIQINKQGENFPILGYSYYNYAYTLQDSRPELSIIFSEYASEFSNLDMYFPRPKKFSVQYNVEFIKYFTIGFIVGVIAILIASRKNPKKKRKS